MSIRKIKIPEAFDFLFQPARVKVAEGGRGGGKSENFGRALLIKGMEQPENIVCGREFQSSIKDSVHSMLAYLINEERLTSRYTVLDTEIRGTNGTVFSFVGVRRNINNIKSMHNIKRFWGEEAHTFSKQSLDILFPTVRAPDSELWFSLNADLEEDPAYQALVVNPPPNSIVRRINYYDNPYFPDVLRKDMEHMKATDYEKYLWIWEGHPRTAVEGAIFAKELHRAQQEGRIRHVPYVESEPVHTFWDLGHSDQTAIWFAQLIGGERRILRYYSNSQEKMHHYLKYLQELPYVYGTHYLPHDAEHELLGAEKTIRQQVEDVYRNVEVVPRVTQKVHSIEAARSIFSTCFFDKELCADGLTCLRRYAYHKSEETGRISKEPEHNIWSHGSDAFQTLAMALEQRQKPYRSRYQSYPNASRRDPYEG